MWMLVLAFLSLSFAFSGGGKMLQIVQCSVQGSAPAVHQDKNLGKICQKPWLESNVASKKKAK